jgi:long-chain acyl-CoA synthetase
VELMTEIERLRGGPVDEQAVAEARDVGALLALEQGPDQREPEAATRFPRWSLGLLPRAVRRLMQPALVLPLARHYAKVRVRGREHLDALQGPVIFASNHQSHLDTPAILAALPARFRYRVAPAMSKEFFAAHFHPRGHAWRERFVRGLQYYLAVLSFNAFPLPQRESGAGGALRYAGELAADGWSILIFPEGVRTDAGEIHAFRPGVAMMAARLSLPVVPVRLRGLEKVLHKTATHATQGDVEVAFGAPLYPTGEDREKFAAAIQAAVRSL